MPRTQSLLLSRLRSASLAMDNWVLVRYLTNTLFFML